MTVPYIPGSDTSEAAARSMTSAAGIVRARVFDFIAERGERGATCDEVEVELLLTHQTASARVHELMRSGVLVDSGQRRVTRSGRKATVWRECKGQMPLPLPAKERPAREPATVEQRSTGGHAPNDPEVEKLRAALAPFAELLNPSTPKAPMVAVMVRRCDLEAANQLFFGGDRPA